MYKINSATFEFANINEIHPKGWMKKQLEIQKNGLSGNLNKFWPDIKDSQWIGGNKEGWERLPYWLDGFIPLAWLLNDYDMKKRAKKYINYIIENQKEDGWICPSDNVVNDKYDIWAFFLILKVLVVYHDATNDKRIENVVNKSLLSIDKHIDSFTIFQWDSTRWFESLIPIIWLYKRKKEKWIIELAYKIKSQGFDWQELFNDWPYKKPEKKGRWSQMNHVVNNAMSLRGSALWWKISGNKKDLKFAYKMSDILDKYHGMATGVFTGDECLSGLSPTQGTELCAVVEHMYSLENLISITGDNIWSDRLEKIAFNALPATLSPDMWTHQYDQQVNQVECSIQNSPIYSTNGGDSSIFGLEPNYGCCTANFSQGWPKLVWSSIMKSKNGIAITSYIPNSINTCLNNVEVSIEVKTDYPFNNKITLIINCSYPVSFELNLRIPTWTENANININGTEKEITDNGYFQINKKWKKTNNITLTLPMKPKLIKRPNNLYAIQKGPLIFSLPIKEEWKMIKSNNPVYTFPHCNYEILPKSSWNYGLLIDKNNLENEISFENFKISDFPFNPCTPPIKAHVKVSKIKWLKENGSAKTFPESNQTNSDSETLSLIPYGCTNLRMTEMPII